MRQSKKISMRAGGLKKRREQSGVKDKGKRQAVEEDEVHIQKVKKRKQKLSSPRTDPIDRILLATSSMSTAPVNRQ